MDQMDPAEYHQIRTAYLSACNRRIGNQKAKAEEEMHLAEERLKQYSQQIVEETRASIENRGKLTYLRACQIGEVARHQEEFRRLIALPDVLQVDVSDEVLRVFTNTIYVEHRGKRYEVGEFRLDVHFEGYLMARNLRNRGRDPLYDHPHIKDGAICMGNIREGIVKLIAEYQFSVVAQIMIDFLRTYNELDAHCPITLWRESPE